MFEKRERLTIVDCVGITRGMVRAGYAFRGNFPCPNGSQHKLQQIGFRITDRDGKVSILAAMFASQSDCAFSVDKTGNVGSLRFA